MQGSLLWVSGPKLGENVSRQGLVPVACGALVGEEGPLRKATWSGASEPKEGEEFIYTRRVTWSRESELKW